MILFSTTYANVRTLCTGAYWMRYGSRCLASEMVTTKAEQRSNRERNEKERNKFAQLSAQFSWNEAGFCIAVLHCHGRSGAFTRKWRARLSWNNEHLVHQDKNEKMRWLMICPWPLLEPLDPTSRSFLLLSPFHRAGLIQDNAGVFFLLLFSLKSFSLLVVIVLLSLKLIEQSLRRAHVVVIVRFTEFT